MFPDPVAALGLAANIFQFVEQGCKVVSKGKRLYKSADGALKENVDTEIIAKDLEESLSRFRLSSSTGSDRLERLRDGCVQVIDELLEALDKLKVNGKPGKWKSGRKALRSVYSKGKVDEWVERLAAFRSEFQIHIQIDML